MALLSTQDEFLPKARGGRSVPLIVTALVLLAAGLAVYGADFYRLDVQSRVDHPDFRTLSPSGPIGHGYGIAGTALMLTNLLYLLRRRLARWHLGAMRTWLDIHVFTGLFGSVLVIYHSAFQLRNGIATLTAVSLSLVVLSGLIGRYFYALSPQQNAQHLDLALAQLEAHWPGLAAALADLTAHFEPPRDLQRPTLLTALGTIPTWMAQARLRRKQVIDAGDAALASISVTSAQRRMIRRHVKHVAQQSAAAIKITAGTHLLRTWRGLHRLMALLMIFSVTVHIAVAWYFGFRWVLSE